MREKCGILTEKLKGNEKMIEKIKAFIKSDKFWKLVRYGVVGVCTTAVNYVLFWLLCYKLDVELNTANAIAIVASVVFAYVTNKLFVFKSHVHGAVALAREAISFFASRAFTAVLEWAVMYAVNKFVGLEESLWGMVTKIAINVVVLILNFVFSQFFVFKGEKK